MSDQLQKQAIELAWRHWTALGVAGVAPRPEHAIDLEALIAFTPFIAAADPRLERECLDWCVRIGPNNVSISRLRQIVRLMPERGDAIALDLARIMIETASGRRLRPKLSHKSRSPRLDHPSLIQLRSRRIFGVSARADLVVALVTRARNAEAGRSSAILPVGYTKRTVALIIDDLVDAGILEKLVISQAASYKPLKVAPLRALLAPLPEKTPSWPERFALVAAILETWRTFGARAPTTYAIELAKVLDKLRPLAARIGEKPPIIGRPQAILAALERWSSAMLAP